jgi:transglutaminase-like putative cysteine protease
MLAFGPSGVVGYSGERPAPALPSSQGAKRPTDPGGVMATKAHLLDGRCRSGSYADDPFLRGTLFCDIADPEIGRLAATFDQPGVAKRDIAVQVFDFAQNGIAYEVGNWQRSASQTLRRRKGTCTNSANLMVALLRRLGIPAGYGVLTVSGREYLGPAIPRRLTCRVSERSKHTYVCVRLDDEWLRCDPSDDKALSTASHHLNPQCTPVTWTGVGDALLNLDPAHILDDEYPLANIDAVMAKPMRFAMRVPVRIGNHFIEFLRDRASLIDDTTEVERHFEQWLSARYPVSYRLYRLLPEPSPSQHSRSGLRAPAPH